MVATLQSTITEHHPRSGADFGTSVALSAHAILIGAPGSGRVWTARAASGWLAEQSFPSLKRGAAFGADVALDGGLAVVGDESGTGAVSFTDGGSENSSVSSLKPLLQSLLH